LSAKKAPAKKKPAVKKRGAAKKKAPVRTKTMAAKRADYGASIDVFFHKLPEQQREVLETLHTMIVKEFPEATTSLKWGMPFYSHDKTMTIALGAHKAHVNLILAGPTELYADPKGLLEGTSKLGRHLKMQKLADLPKKEARAWIKAAVKHARERDA
jgi:hypothetical protein